MPPLPFRFSKKRPATSNSGGDYARIHIRQIVSNQSENDDPQRIAGSRFGPICTENAIYGQWSYVTSFFASRLFSRFRLLNKKSLNINAFPLIYRHALRPARRLKGVCRHESSIFAPAKDFYGPDPSGHGFGERKWA